MEIRKYTNLQAFNKFGMYEFELAHIEDGSDNGKNVIFQASQGYREHFGAEIRFIGVGYIACACFFLFAHLRCSSLQEFPLGAGFPGFKPYCFEETGHSPKQYYIVAKDVEVIVHYTGENVEAAFELSDRIEAGEV